MTENGEVSFNGNLLTAEKTIFSLRFKDSYIEMLSFLTNRPKAKGMCEMNFAFAHGGRNDCRRHTESKSHHEIGMNIKNKNLPIELFILFVQILILRLTD